MCAYFEINFSERRESLTVFMCNGLGLLVSDYELLHFPVQWQSGLAESMTV